MAPPRRRSAYEEPGLEEDRPGNPRTGPIRIPVPCSDESPGELSIDLGRQRPSTPWQHPSFVDALGRVVAIACRGSEVVSKVAALSRTAFRTSAALRAALEGLDPSSPIVAASLTMRGVLAQAELVAPHTTSVLIRGESGTGKELIARHIHERSDRKDGPFVAVNCAALPEGLIESELFGHEPGAFTGARAMHKGRFERAAGGTLFLDEIGELPQAVQAKLLRALQDREIERVGGEQAIPVDVRVISATHQALEEHMENGRFRSDLFYRLSAFPVFIPALRERPEDIALIAQAKIGEIYQSRGKRPPELTGQDLDMLIGAPWPGNVRELQNHIERAIILSGEGPLRLDLGSAGPSGRAAPWSPIPGSTEVPTLAEATRRSIEAALREAKGKLYGPGGAAELLDVHPSTLQAKMAKLGVQRRDFA